MDEPESSSWLLFLQLSPLISIPQDTGNQLKRHFQTSTSIAKSMRLTSALAAPRHCAASAEHFTLKLTGVTFSIAGFLIEELRLPQPHCPLRLSSYLQIQLY